jgi:3-oxoacyl-[acyl-carrier protein] reductase
LIDQGTGRSLYTVPGDVRTTGWDDVLTYAAREGWQLGAVVNNAGVNALSIDSIIDTNVKGYIKGIRLAAQAGVRRIINVGSIAGVRPMRGSMVYCASKAAVDMLTKQAARELAPRTQIFGLNPGRLEGTAMTKKVDEDVMRVRSWENTLRSD